MAAGLDIVWDDSEGGNVDHLAEHDVTREEFQQVLGRALHERQVSRSNPRHWIARGFTDAGRYLMIVFEFFEADGMVNPVTAYDLEEP